MVGRTIKIGTCLAAVVVASLALVPSNAYADYAPRSSDVVGVGSDTLQQLVDFVADGDFLGDAGYNGAGNVNKFISIDATADANTRLAYGSAGLGSSTTALCGPGTGSAAGSQGTGNDNGNHIDTPCTLNPTVVLRAGLSPTQRPNGSGAGFALLVADTNTTTGKSLHGVVDYSRASSSQNGAHSTLYDSVTIGTDPLNMLSASTTGAHATNAVALTTAQLTKIYNCDPTARTWDQVGGTSTDNILPLLPQVGSGTRKSFLSLIGVTTPGNCVVNVEENDPEAIDASTSPADAIEPMSGGRLNLFLGKLSTGTTNGVGGYFKDPSCPQPPNEDTTGKAACTTGSTLTPNVKLWNGAGAFTSTRNLYIYFRHADIESTKIFQPGGKLNWVRTMLYNPCDAGQTCVTDPATGAVYGPGGAPYFATSAAQSLISASGITPAYTYNVAGP